jgi:hypothetical protein
MTERFDKIDQTLAHKAEAADVQRLLNLLDQVLKRLEVEKDERVVMGSL